MEFGRKYVLKIMIPLHRRILVRYKLIKIKVAKGVFDSKISLIPGHAQPNGIVPKVSHFNSHIRSTGPMMRLLIILYLLIFKITIQQSFKSMAIIYKNRLKGLSTLSLYSVPNRFRLGV
jgi:hypothetical protein